MEKKTFEEIIKFGNLASSADNMQNFKITPSKDLNSFTLEIPKKKEGFIDYKYVTSQISCGCFLRNIRLACEGLGFECDIKYDQSKNPFKIAKVELKESKEEKNNKILHQIEKRSCDRRKFTNKKVSRNFLNKILLMKDNDINIYLFEKENENYNHLVNSIFNCEKIRFFLKEGHEEFYKEVRYSIKEVEEKKDGLDYRLLGLPKYLDKFIVKQFSKWSFTSRIIKFGGIKMLSKSTSYDLFHSSQGMFVLTLKERSKVNYLKMGELFQTIWIEITKENGSLQPFAPLPFFYFMINNGAKNKFFDEQIPIINEEHKKFRKNAKINNNEEIAMLFRFGVPKKQKIKSLRKDVKDLINYN